MTGERVHYDCPNENGLSNSTSNGKPYYQRFVALHQLDDFHRFLVLVHLDRNVR